MGKRIFFSTGYGVALVALAVGACAIATPAAAQTIFEKPLNLIIPYAAGGLADATARHIGDGLREQLGQPVIPVNRVGASGNVGLGAAVAAPADGYTIAIVSNGNMIQSPFMYKLAFDTQKDLAPITQIVSWGSVLVVPASSPATNMRQYIELAKSRAADPINIGVAGNGSQVTYGMLASAAGIKFTTVLYKNENEFMIAVLSGDLSSAQPSLTLAKTQAAAGKVRAIGFTGPKRTPLWPELPAIAETVPGFSSTFWFGFVAPAKSPSDKIAALSRSINAIIKTPVVNKYLVESGLDVLGTTPEEFAASMKDEYAKTGKIIRELNLKGTDG